MDFQKLVEYRNAHNPFTKRLHVVLEEIGPGYARTAKVVEPEDLNPVNVPHGGVYFTMADNACGSAAASRGYAAVTVNANYHFLRSAKLGDRLTAEAREVKAGKTISIYEARITDQDGVLLGIGTFTFYSLDRKLEH